VEAETLATAETTKAAELHQQAQRLLKEYKSSKKGREALGKGNSEAAEAAQIQKYAKEEDPQAKAVIRALDQAKEAQTTALQARRAAATDRQ
jgi:hypothetical protein